MKKFFAISLALLLLLTTAACGQTDASTDGTTTTTSSTTAVATTTTTVQNEPASYAAALRITINPEFTMYIDAEKKVLAVLCLNQDASDVAAGLSLVGKPCTEALTAILNAAEDKNFDLSNTKISISGGNQNVGEGLGFYDDVAEDVMALPFTLDVASPTYGDTTTTTTTTTKSTTTTTTTKATTTTTKAAVTKNPQTDLEFDLEYIGNFIDNGSQLDASALQFESYEGGVCVVTSRMFEAEKTDPDQVAFEQFGKQWYSVGGGQTPHYYELTATEIIVKGSMWSDQPDAVNIRLVLLDDGTIKVTEVNAELAARFPVGTVMKIYFR